MITPAQWARVAVYWIGISMHPVPKLKGVGDMTHIEFLRSQRIGLQ